MQSGRQQMLGLGFRFQFGASTASAECSGSDSCRHVQPLQDGASPAEVRLRTAAATVACAWALNARPARSRQSRRPSLPPRQTRFGRQQQKLQTRLQQTCVLSRPPCTALRRQAEDVEPSKEALTVRCSFTLSHCYFFLAVAMVGGVSTGE